jgi:hypothetical protein
MVDPLSKQESKDAVKEALHEWLDEKYSTFGKWSLHSFLALLVAAACYFVLAANGWHK